MRPTGAERWKRSVVVLAAMVGAYLGFRGYSAPRLSAASIVATAGPAVTANASHAGTGGSAAAGTAGSAAAGTAGSAAARTAAETSGGASAAAAGRPHPATAGAAPRTAATGSAKTPARGPLLASTRWWPYAHQVYPPVASAATRAAVSGFHISFSKAGAGLERVRVDTGVGKTQSATFRQTDRLYMIEGGMGDDGFQHDTNFGDDAFVLTDKGGHIVGK